MKHFRARQLRAARHLQPEPAAEAAERTGYGPKLTLEGDYLILRWRKEQVPEALDSANMTLYQIVATHLAPRLEATKIIDIKYRGETTARFEVIDRRAQLEMARLCLQLHGLLPAD